MTVCLLGEFSYFRAYYHCSHCHHGWHPTDAELGLRHHQTTGAQEVTALAGVIDSFAKAAEQFLPRLAGLRVSESTVLRVTEDAGAAIATAQTVPATSSQRSASEIKPPCSPTALPNIATTTESTSPASTSPASTINESAIVASTSVDRPITTALIVRPTTELALIPSVAVLNRSSSTKLTPVAPVLIESWQWPIDADGHSTAYVSLDATSVPQQGLGGKKAEGRMPSVGSVFCPEIQGDPDTRRHKHARYISGLMSLDEMGQRLRQECECVGVANADMTICLTDGGNGLEDCLAYTALGGLSRETVMILDFYHCGEKVCDLLKLITPAGQLAAVQTEWLHQLKHAGGAVTLARVESLDTTSYSESTVEMHRVVNGYLRNNLHRTDYPRYREHGWCIGSGHIESACKTVVNQRLKNAGMRWRERGTTALCHLRALYRSDPHLWQAHWSRPAKPTVNST